MNYLNQYETKTTDLDFRVPQEFVVFERIQMTSPRAQIPQEFGDLSLEKRQELLEKLIKRVKSL